MFKDHYSDLSYTHLHEVNSGESILEDKRAFEAFSRSHNATVKHYHTDNRRFGDKAFTLDAKASG